MTDRPPTPDEADLEPAPERQSVPDATVSGTDGAGSATDTPLAAAAAADASTDLARTDTANTTLATLSGVLLTVLTAGAGLTSGDGSYPVPALVAMGAAAVLLALALVVLTTALWPRAGGSGGVPAYAAQSPARLHLQLGETCPGRWHAERAVAKARIATRKHTAQRVAAVALAAAGVLLAVATVLTLATGS